MEQQIIEILQHIRRLNDDYTQLAQEMAVIRTNVEWLTKFFWLIVSIVVANLVASLLHFREVRKNNSSFQNKEGRR